MSCRGSLLALLSVLGLVLLGGAPARAQKVQLQLESNEAYAGLPFVLAMVAEGFDENPTPEPPELSIAGCETTYLGVRPDVSQGVRIINGRRSEWRRVRFVYRWRIEAEREGEYTVPALTLKQGAKSASTRPANMQVNTVASSDDMRIRLNLPDRPVWTGETFEVTLDWLLRRDVGDHKFSVPLFDLDHVQVQPGNVKGRKLVFPAGALDIELPYTQGQVREGGESYTRFRFSALVTVNRPGAIDVDPVKVAAQLQAGTGRDTFGFRVPQYQLFKAEGQRRRLTVKPLPQQGRPASFENAIGTAYSLEVRASRTVVQVGDPVELQIRVRGNGPLEGLGLPDLEGPEALPAELFSVPDAPEVGVIDPEGGGKTFDVTVRVRSSEVTEIPPLAFSYFDPQAGEYRTVHSEPVALSVAGGALVGADQVESAAPVTTTEANDPAAGSSGRRAGIATATLIGADLSLSAPERTLRRSWAAGSLAPWIVGLYMLPLFVLVGRIWQVRTSGRRGREGDLRQALSRVEQALEGARPAREAAPEVTAAVRTLARLTGNESQHAAAVERLETRAYDPQAGDQPVPAEIRDAVLKLVRSWASTAGALLLACGALALSTGLVTAAGQEDEAARLEHARNVYQTALEENDRVRRTRLFAEAEQILRELASANPASPDLLADWGNAALGAQEIGRATLAYRRALHLDPGHERAVKNLDWIRQRSPEWLPRPAGAGALDSLVFWHHRLSLGQRHLIGALSFAAALLLLAPWSTARRPLLRRLALVALVVWVAFTGSALLDGDPAAEGVLVDDGTVLRSADNLGAPPVLSTPLPAGTELRMLERRSGWTRVSLADGTRGWIQSSTAAAVVPREG